ncbi:hypothetical protein VN12_12260 [Pirellula sp. SH-Sr6A]|uniref:DUF1501 domain-containing protein n=1 Tax=Pirellula sp. SH-Sr6A TaxID=1632865 RepID=UPI00078EAEAA|nr:DUF1501 domain-containing protein [Pirellula sp. SH-Sr6A]AMV32892.1 hypothetical protein VN12_12260 [Pirellula sp. SH-Sr6A]
MDTFQVNRRQWLQNAGMGFGGIALHWMLSNEKAVAEIHHPPKAKRVIWLFLEGGPSHLDLLDPKPLLNELSGKPLPSSFREPITAMGEKGAPLLASPRQWKQYGESGLYASDWIPHIGECLDDIAVIRSCWTNGINHAGGVCQMNTCLNFAGRPSLGSWVNFGLGTENENLPAFVVLCDNAGRPVNGPRNWGSGFMPASYQGVRIQGGEAEPIPNLRTPEDQTGSRLETKLQLLKQFNQSYAALHPQQSELEARIRSYELAFRMQAEAPEALDLSQETEETQQLYGLDQKETQSFGRNCLLARRLVERGVRFVQLYSGTGSKWDSHADIEKNHGNLCRSMDKPVAGLLKDLKQRGLLDDTLVIWGGEFGRTPMSEKGNGRDHNPTGFTIWMAGGGVKGGQTIGATDELGLYAIEDKMHVHDIHASILWLLGLDNMKLTYDHKGRIERPTINEGRFQKKLITG